MHPGNPVLPHLSSALARPVDGRDTRHPAVDTPDTSRTPVDGTTPHIYAKGGTPLPGAAFREKEQKSGLGLLAHGGNAEGNDLARHLTRPFRRHRLGREQHAAVVLQLLDGLEDVGQGTVAAVLIRRLGESGTVPALSKLLNGGHVHEA